MDCALDKHFKSVNKPKQIIEMRNLRYTPSVFYKKKLFIFKFPFSILPIFYKSSNVNFTLLLYTCAVNKKHVYITKERGKEFERKFLYFSQTGKFV
jgi:hypothetical protein